jgi:hypothetical protein
VAFGLTSALVQNAKHSKPANVLRFTPELRHCSEQLACLKGANHGHSALITFFAIRQSAMANSADVGAPTRANSSH